MPQKNIFVVGLDDFQRRQLSTTRHARDPRYAIHGLLPRDALVHVDAISIDGLLDDARRQLDAFPGSVDAIIAHWDFPTSALVPILCAERGLPAPSLRGVVQCEHKYWSRLRQREVIPEYTPPFAVFDPFADDPLADIDLDFPFWVKPVKGFSSLLGFRVDGPESFGRALDTIRGEIHRLGDPFADILARLDLPPAFAHTATMCLAEAYLTGLELAHEGHVFEGEVRMHGTLDMVRHRETFHRYEHPSELPMTVWERVDVAGRRLLEHLRFDNGVFNAEYFWDPETDRIGLVEVNPRMSQSHTYLWDMVDGASNHEIAIDVALGERPRLHPGQGRHRKAAKAFYRAYAPGVVRRVPTPDELARVEADFPDCRVALRVEPGQNLEALVDQDAYSFELAEIYVAADSRAALLERCRAICGALSFEIERAGRLEAPAPPAEQCPACEEVAHG
ncbi:MAG: hypothetical protein KC583_14745 [Myxococcales bacterium]|nr:hypothetical protein [Myxococcales bacterium]